MKFDVIIMNPPYQDHSNKHSPLWQKFVKKSIGIVKENGYVCSINPPNWRKPEHELMQLLSALQIHYLEMHGTQDGQKTFGCGTQYDLLVMQNKSYSKNTVCVDQNGTKKNVNLNSTPFVPNANLELIMGLIAKEWEEKVELLYSRSAYGSDKPHMSREECETCSMPCIHATSSKGIKLWYSAKKTTELFDCPKVVLGLAGWRTPFLDDKGTYGLTQNCFAIRIKNKKEGEAIIKALSSPNAVNMMELLIWSGFALDFRAISSFRKDFWKEFVDEDGKEI